MTIVEVFLSENRKENDENYDETSRDHLHKILSSRLVSWAFHTTQNRTLYYH